MDFSTLRRRLPVPGARVAALLLCLGATAVPAQVVLTPEELFAVARSAGSGAQPDLARASALLDRIEADHPASDLAALIRLYRDSGMTDDAVIGAIDARLAGAAPAAVPAAPPEAAPPAAAPGFATAVPAPAAPGFATATPPATAPGFATVAPAPVEPAAPGVIVPLAPAPQATAPMAPAAPPPPAFEADEALLRLTRDERREVQGRLNSLGYAAGTPDGAFGPRSRAAIAEWQGVEGIAPTGFLSAAQLALLRQTSVTSYPEWLAAQPVRRTTRPTQSTNNRWRATNDPCAIRPTDSRGQLRRECDRR